MTPDEEDALSDRLPGIETAPLVSPEGEMGRNWVPDDKDAAELARTRPV